MNGPPDVPGQFKDEPGIFRPVVKIVPVPGVTIGTPQAAFGQVTIAAPVGITPRPSVGALLVFCCERNVFIVIRSYAIPPPARRIVVPLPEMSQATPKRGAKFV